MNFSFHSPDLGLCIGRLWATGRYGFSLPKKVDIVAPDGATYTYLYFNKRVQLKEELANRTIVRIAIAQFLAGEPEPGGTVEIDPDTAPYAGELAPSRAVLPRTPLRVRPGKLHARPTPACEPG
jgi:hypothetical protein